MSDKLPLYISVFNNTQIELALNHLWSLRRVLPLANYMAYVTDRVAEEHLRTRGYHVTFHEPEPGCSLSFARYKVISDLLEQGVDVWYLDVSTVVIKPIRNLYTILLSLPETPDIVLQDDTIMPCTGCMIWFSNPRTIRMARIMSLAWNAKSTVSDQIVFNKLVNTLDLVRVATWSAEHMPVSVTYFKKGFVEHGHLEQGRAQAYRQIVQLNKHEAYLVNANFPVDTEQKISALISNGLWFVA